MELLQNHGENDGRIEKWKCSTEASKDGLCLNEFLISGGHGTEERVMQFVNGPILF